MNLAYVAGIIDGEGCLDFTQWKRRIFPRVQITHTNLDLLEDIKAKFGGDIRPVQKLPKHWKQSYVWRISNIPAVDFIDRIFPWLHIKHNQALLFFGWDAIRPGIGRAWNEEGLSTCELLNAQRKWLNFKGSGNKGPEPMEMALNGV